MMRLAPLLVCLTGALLALTLSAHLSDAGTLLHRDDAQTFALVVGMGLLFGLVGCVCPSRGLGLGLALLGAGALGNGLAGLLWGGVPDMLAVGQLLLSPADLLLGLGFLWSLLAANFTRQAL